jgi:uncharacterized protein (DUF58 family)
MWFQLWAFIPRVTRRRSTRLTAEGLLFLLLTVGVGVAAINTGNNLYYLLLSMMLSLILVSGIAAEHCLRRLTFHRHLPDLCFVNEPTTVTVVVKNEKSRFPSFSLRFLEVMNGAPVDRGLLVDRLLPGTTRLLSYPLTATRRGRIHLDGICAVTSFPFGLFVKTAYYPLRDTAIVCPEIMPLDEGLLNNVMARGHEHHVRRRGHGNDLYNLRLYQAGDDSRKIHWVSTAKTSQLIVRETEAEHQRRATIHLATIAPATHEAVFEEAVSFTASVVFHLSERNYDLRLVAGSSRSAFGQGEAHRTALLQSLALCERRDPDTDLDAGDDPRLVQADGEDGTVLAVRPWDGAGFQHIGDPTVVFPSAMFARGHDGAR